MNCMNSDEKAEPAQILCTGKKQGNFHHVSCSLHFQAPQRCPPLHSCQLLISYSEWSPSSIFCINLASPFS